MRGKVLAALFICIIAFSQSLPAAEGEPGWGVGVRYGSFGVPDKIADRFLDEHPSISGSISGIELRYYGSGGPSGSLSIALTVDYGFTSAEGLWKKDTWSKAVYAEGELNMLAATITGYWDIFASMPLHPYAGIGFGYAMVDGSYMEEAGEVNISEGLPALHLPVGLALNLGDRLTIRAEARIINALSLGGCLMINF